MIYLADLLSVIEEGTKVVLRRIDSGIIFDSAVWNVEELTKDLMYSLEVKNIRQTDSFLVIEIEDTDE